MKITPKIRKFLDYWMDGYKVIEAAEMAGYSPDYGYVILGKLRNTDNFKELMDFMGLTDDYLVRKNKELLEAKTPKWNSELKQWDTFEDGGIQSRNLELALKLKGKLKDEVDHSGEVVIKVIHDKL